MCVLVLTFAITPLTLQRISQAMTKIENVFMLSIDAKLDYETLRKVCVTGHSRIPVYEEVELPAPDGQNVKAKKILGVLFVKQAYAVSCLPTEMPH
jgi:CBS domain containing-hemolysin-like protein